MPSPPPPRLGGAGDPGRAGARDRGALSACHRSPRSPTGSRRAHEANLEPLADRQLPGQRADRRRRRASSGAASRGSTAIPCSAACSTRRATADAVPRGEWRIEVENQVSPQPALSAQHADPGQPPDRRRRRQSPRSIDFCPRFERPGRMYRPVAFIRIVRPVAGAPRIRMRAQSRAPTGARPTPSGPAAPTTSASCSSRSRCA